MADFDFEPPSFSLGFDLDIHSEPQTDSQPHPLVQPAKRPSTTANLRTIEEEDDDFESPVGVSDRQVSDSPRAFKRLRRGATARKAPSENIWRDVDDEIEDFSSEEDRPRGSLSTNSICSSSKSSLNGQRALTSESGSEWKSNKRKDVPSTLASANTERNGSSVIFPKLTVSPLRRFQLIDSDSDDPSESEGKHKKAPYATSSLNKKTSDSSKHADLIDLGAKNASAGKYQPEDLWKNFHSEKSSHIPTPAFDEVCEEYFTSVKNKSVTEIDQKDPKNGMKGDVASLPPSHCYFFHKDSRIKKLVRDRLLYFFPLGAGNNQEYKQQNASVIDYMGQFGHEDNSRKTGQRCNADKSSTRSKKNIKEPKVDNNLQDPENWINPKSSVGLPKNAGNRRVQAAGKSMGHWYTGANGQRVYVNKNGQELTGQIAYRHYRKESGVGFKKSKKKTTAKKKSAPKKK